MKNIELDNTKYEKITSKNIWDTQYFVTCLNDIDIPVMVWASSQGQAAIITVRYWTCGHYNQEASLIFAVEVEDYSRQVVVKGLVDGTPSKEDWKWIAWQN